MRTTETRAQIEVKLGILFELVDAAAGFHDINRRSDKIVHAVYLIKGGLIRLPVPFVKIRLKIDRQTKRDFGSVHHRDRWVVKHPISGTESVWLNDCLRLHSG